ncbi:MAG: hypothetical protein DRP85_06470 [Candidatus Makaraimicrobium thalassicum]|nr:MAG: hypothetical protein DRP85_06470 [Candidatus Omnitrophota bacterium]
MSTISFFDLLTELRIELSDEDKTEWSDLKLMSFVNRAMKRIHEIIIRNELNFAIKSVVYTVESGVTEIALPDDFMIQKGLYRRDTSKFVEFATDDTWERVSEKGDGLWRLAGENFVISSNIPVGTELAFYYFPMYQRETDTLEAVIYGDQIWDAIIIYASYLCKNVDEFDLSVDAQILGDVESQLLMMYNRNTPQRAHLES